MRKRGFERSMRAVLHATVFRTVQVSRHRAELAPKRLQLTELSLNHDGWHEICRFRHSVRPKFAWRETACFQHGWERMETRILVYHPWSVRYTGRTSEFENFASIESFDCG